MPINTVMKNSFSDLRKFIVEIENKHDKLVLEKLSYKKTDLEPVLSKKNLDAHYGVLAKGYVDRYNSGEGDAKFNEAGAFLHNIFFKQFKSAGTSNKPFGSSLELINKHYTDYENFQEEFKTEAMKIQGSGWLYLSRSGKIKTIKNHEIRTDIVLLLDWWEHAWFTDYGPDKQKYFNNIWRIIDWTVINDRINLTKE